MLQQAPFLHVHEKGHAAHHVTEQHSHGTSAHAHLVHHPARWNDKGIPAAGSVDASESAIGVSFFQSEIARAPIPLLATRAYALIEHRAMSDVRVPRQRPRIHDPPVTARLIPRAPPA
jgi:hypothetical protein